MNGRPLHVRWLGRVDYDDAWALQQGIFSHSEHDHLLLLEHPHVYTLGVRADEAHVLVPPASVGAQIRRVDRGGDVTYHGPGQLVGYPLLHVPGKRGGGMADTAAYVASVEQLLIDALERLGLPGCGRLAGHPGVWVEPESGRPRKIAAIGVRLTRGRSMHGFALNVAPDLSYFDHIVPCGIVDKAVSSLAAEGIHPSMQEVVDVVAGCAAARFAAGPVDRADVVWRHRASDLSPFSRGSGPGAVARDPRSRPGRMGRRREQAGVEQSVAITARKPPWLRAPVEMGSRYRDLKATLRRLELVTVCEEAGCPNIYECWADGTATFMINGDRCTRACGFCLVDTRKPEAPDADEPERLARAVETLAVDYAVITTVARDDLDDGGAAQFVACIDAIRRRTPQVGVEVLISDCRGDADALQAIFAARPDVLNHNIETVARLQRMARPSASYARSLAVLARAKAAGLTTKSSVIVGMGEQFDEVVGTLADLRAVGVDIVTIGQYLRPTTNHLPVARWVEPEEFDRWAEIGRGLGIGHVEASPLTRSSYHARQAAARTTPAVVVSRTR